MASLHRRSAVCAGWPSSLARGPRVRDCCHGCRARGGRSRSRRSWPRSAAGREFTQNKLSPVVAPSGLPQTIRNASGDRGRNAQRGGGRNFRTSRTKQLNKPGFQVSLKPSVSRVKRRFCIRHVNLLRSTYEVETCAGLGAPSIVVFLIPCNRRGCRSGPRSLWGGAGEAQAAGWSQCSRPHIPWSLISRHSPRPLSAG